MLKTLLKVVGVLACVAGFNLAAAASMGGINVTSALGHPLKAEISLAELGQNDRDSLSAKLATVNEFKNAGLDFPYSLPKLTFEVATRSNGETYLKLSSTQPVNEPFVTLLIELSWSSGKLLREYTFLLDPAGFAPEQPKMTEVKPVEPMVPVPEFVPAPVPEAAALPVAPEAAPFVPEAVPVPVPALVETSTPPAEEFKKDVKPEVEPVKAELAAPEHALAEPGKVLPAEQVKMEPLAPSPQLESVPGSVLVEKGDTLGRIAEEVKPVDVSLERMLVAMYRANTKTFDGKNMNRIRAGKILRIPESDEIAKVSQAAAVKEIRAQVADWQDYRQKLAAAQSNTPEEAPKQESAGKISTAVAEKAPAVKEPAKEVLRLSKGETLGDKTVSGNAAKTKQEKLTAKADDKAAQEKQAQEEQKKIAKLEGINKDVSKLVELKGLPPAQDVAPEAVPKKAPTPRVAKPVPVVTPANDEFDVMEWLNKNLATVMDDPVILGGIAVLILALGGAGFAISRRGKGTQKKTTKKNEKVGESTGSWRTPIAPSPDTGDFTQSYAPAAPTVAMSVAELDDVDPISEADLFLNFGRDVQAEEILKDALAKNPSNIQIKLKLLSIYVNRKDSNSFSRYAQEVKDSGDTAAWERAAVMGRELDPGNPNYGGVKGEVRLREPAAAEVDFDLGLGKAAAPAASTGSQVAAQDFKMDFDVTETQSGIDATVNSFSASSTKTTSISQTRTSANVDATSILSREDLKSAQAATPMDFDISGILPSDVKSVSKSTSMDFDLSGSNLGASAGAKNAEQSDSMDFDVSSSNFENTTVISESQSSAASSRPALNFDDLVFEIPTSKPEPASAPSKAPADDGMAFSIDFPTSVDIAPESGKSNASTKLDMDFGDININMEDDTPPVHEGGEGKDEQWHEVATKLDLAKAYQEMGDADGAREILEEVKRDGDVKQRESADKLLQQIAA